ncbi:exopolysaccharide biosynthesis polyprenyl glycosylphosphotransferase [Orbaceae bacterium ac157xtp]
MLKVRFIKLYQLDEEFFENHSKNDFSILSSKRQQISKRIFDVIFSIFLLGITFPILILTIFAIKLESKGPFFYTQERIGLNNCAFKVIKFRSMRTDAERHGAKWAQKNDPRVTKVGSFIRKTRIDELPQLFNVIKGEMSLIGPRPERKIFIEKLEKEIKYYNFRHKIKPGITGLAQVCYPYGSSIKDAKWKHKYDIYYIKHYSFKLDCLIVIATIKTILFGMGR